MASKIHIGIFICLCLSFKASAQDRQFGIGLRLGDFSGLCIKKYFNGNLALEGNLGQSFFWIYNYEGKFDEFATEAGYIDARLDTDGIVDKKSQAANIRMQLEKEFKNIPRLFWYIGSGVQMVRMQHNFLFFHRQTINGASRIQQVAELYDLTLLGLEALFGVEYRFEEIPMTIFLDNSFFLELLDAPGEVMFQLGLGARFDF